MAGTLTLSALDKVADVSQIRNCAKNELLGATRANAERVMAYQMGQIADDAFSKLRRLQSIKSSGVQTTVPTGLQAKEQPKLVAEAMLSESSTRSGDMKIDDKDHLTSEAPDVKQTPSWDSKQLGAPQYMSPGFSHDAWGIMQRAIRRVEKSTRRPTLFPIFDKPVEITGQVNPLVGRCHRQPPQLLDPAPSSPKLPQVVEAPRPELKASAPIWKPKGCTLKYAVPYPLPKEPPPKEEPQVEIPVVTHVLPPIKNPWCGCCMRESFDPYKLPCGHIFCKRCIFDTSFFLLRDHSEAVQDTRAVMRCPLKGCEAVVPTLPLINGDFRFDKVRPEDTVGIAGQQLNLCEIHQLSHYKVKLDLDLYTRKSDNLFDGYNDVIVIP